MIAEAEAAHEEGAVEHLEEAPVDAEHLEEVVVEAQKEVQRPSS